MMCMQSNAYLMQIILASSHSEYLIIEIRVDIGANIYYNCLFCVTLINLNSKILEFWMAMIGESN